MATAHTVEQASLQGVEVSQAHSEHCFGSSLSYRNDYNTVFFPRTKHQDCHTCACATTIPCQLVQARTASECSDRDGAMCTANAGPVRRHWRLLPSLPYLHRCTHFGHLDEDSLRPTDSFELKNDDGASPDVECRQGGGIRPLPRWLHDWRCV